MLKTLKQAILTTLVLTLLLGLAYPLAMNGLAGLLFPREAHGSLLRRDGVVIGSDLIGQNFTDARYFHGRPSATTAPDPADSSKTVPAPYNAAASNASNAAPSAKALIDDVTARVKALKAENPDAQGDVPVDLVTSSASGLDPHISLAAALYQVPRVAAARGIPAERVAGMVQAYTEARSFGLFGEPRVNVLRLNLGLDAMTK